ncbi:hydrogenase maturation protease [Aquabacterium sp.]|uniref:hydrogenase maturation protease n=1 Tax=Aquabacterium sp. TaxID=1872578 RepID=UPI0040380F2C
MSLMDDCIGQAPILVLAVGNPSRGDDAFGPLLAQQLQSWLATQTAEVQQAIELITDQQLVVEHALDLQGREQVLFIDAAARHDAPVAMQAVAPAPDATKPSSQHDQPIQPSVNSHSSTPGGLLALYQSLLNQPPPRADLLTLRGEGFELGAPLSDTAQALLPQAWQLLQGWLDQALAHALATATNTERAGHA